MKNLIFSILLATMLFSCKYDEAPPRRLVYNNDVEIFCRDIGRKVLIETTNKQEVIASIQKFINQKREMGTNENYTVLRFSDKSSLLIKKIPPEKLITCSIRNVRPDIVRSYYKY